MSEAQSVLERIEAMFNSWLKELDRSPVQTGLKALVLILVFRWALRVMR